MSRRDTVFGLVAIGAALTGNTALLRAQTSTGSVRRVGVLGPSIRENEEITNKPFYDEMRRLGWLEGHNIAYERTYGDDQPDTLRKQAAKLAARKPDVIYAPPTSAAVAARKATQTIPIVFAVVGNPVGAGLVMNLAHPEGNVTGISSYSKYRAFELGFDKIS